MKRLLTVIFAAGLTFGQVTDPTKPPKPITPARPGDVVKVLNIRSETPPNRGNSAVRTVLGMYPSGSGVEMVFDETSRTLVVRGPAAAVKLIEDTLKVIDVAPPPSASVANVEVTIQLLYASSKEDAKNVVPSELQPTVQQLRAVFPYTSYRVMDTLLLRGRDDQNMSDGGTLSGSNSVYNLEYHPNIGPKVPSRTIRLKNLRFSLRILVSNSYTQVGLNTDIDAREGQKTVVGKMNVSGTEDAIFLVVSPKVIE
ncbi:MAG: secretin N-terminal domain-containing protein [Acidobacteriota bacterium]